jgi:hypothetical protein
MALVGNGEYDEQGRLFYWREDGTRSYVSPVAQLSGDDYESYTAKGGYKGRRMKASSDPRPKDAGGVFRSGWEWDANSGKWKNPIDKSNITNMVVGGLLTAGAANAFMGGTGAVAPLANTTTPAMSHAATTAFPATFAASGTTGLGTMAAGIPAVANAAASGTTGLGTTAAGIPAVANAAAKGMDWSKILGVGGAALIPLLSKLGNNGGGQPGGIQTNADLEELLSIGANRVRRTDPLHRSATNLAMSRMPTNMQLPPEGK